MYDAYGSGNWELKLNERLSSIYCLFQLKNKRKYDSSIYDYLVTMLEDERSWESEECQFSFSTTLQFVGRIVSTIDL